MVTVPVAPPAAGIQEIDCSSWAMVKVPSFLLYEAAPLGGAIVAWMIDSFHCPGQQKWHLPSG